MKFRGEFPPKLTSIFMRYVLSKFAHVFPHPNKQIDALWHSLTLELFFVQRGICQQLVQTRRASATRADILKFLADKPAASTSSFRSLRTAKFLVSIAEDESTYPEQLAAQLETPRFIGVLYLMLCDGCNFHCTYCFENAYEPNDFRPSLMTKEVAEAGLNTFARLLKTYPPPSEHEPKIQFYGGEPLLNEQTFVHAVRYCSILKSRGEIPKRVGMATVTNGTGITDHLAEFIAENGVSVGVSIDGPPTINNLYRKSLTGPDAYTTAMRAFDCLRKAGAKVGASVTLTPEVVRSFDAVLPFLRDVLGVRSGLGFNILHYTKAIRLPADYYEQAAQCILKAFQIFRDIQVWEDRAMRKIVAFVNQRPLHADCAAIGHQIVVAPEGRTGICQDYIKSRRGFDHNVNDPCYDPFEDQTYVEWSRRTPLRMRECHLCPAVAICGGGCPVSAESRTGSMWSIDKRICPHSLKSLEFMIWDTYNSVEITSRRPISCPTKN